MGSADAALRLGRCSEVKGNDCRQGILVRLEDRIVVPGAEGEDEGQTHHKRDREQGADEVRE